jgi:hypothetical protein
MLAIILPRRIIWSIMAGPIPISPVSILALSLHLPYA